MKHFFWDTGVAIGYIFSFENFPTGLKPKDFDIWAPHAFKFHERFSGKVHVISHRTATIEIPNVCTKIEKRIDKARLILDGYDKDDILAGSDGSERGYIMNIVGKKSKWNNDDLVKFLNDINSMIMTNRQHLLSKICSRIHNQNDQQVETILLEVITNSSDALIYSCAANYTDLFEPDTTFVTTDYADLISDKVKNHLKARFPTRILPKIEPLKNVSGYFPPPG